MNFVPDVCLQQEMGSGSQFPASQDGAILQKGGGAEMVLCSGLWQVEDMILKNLALAHPHLLQ